MSIIFYVRKRMGFSSKSQSSSEGWVMGFFLVFFPEEEDHHHHETNEKKKPNNFNLLPSSNFSLKRINSSHLFYKAQSTISICALLVFTTLLFFTISTLPSSTTANPRRQLYSVKQQIPSFSHALQGMGTLYRRGTRAMNDLIVAHAVESLTPQELKLFLRLLYRSSITSKSDILFLFRSKSADFDSTVLEENNSFLKLVKQYNSTQSGDNRLGFDPTHFLKQVKENREPIWGRRIRANLSEEEGNGSTRMSYGSVVGFDVEELDPENSLSGFLDHVPMSLRRWACYPMLLGRVRRNFKHVMLVDMKEVFVLDDLFEKVRTQSQESVFVKVSPAKHGKKTHPKPVNPFILMGGSRGIRRLSNSMLTEIVRAATQKRKKNSVTESLILNQLVGNQFISKDVKWVVSGEFIPELGSLVRSGFPANASSGLVRRGNSNLDVNYSRY